MQKIFISYRRADSGETIGRLYEKLVGAFGKKRIFRDVHSIEPGRDFRAEIEAAIVQSDVMLAVIGPTWLNAKVKGSEARRLDQPDDFVRIEIEMGLRHRLRLIPLLVQGAAMPDKDQLPPSLRDLAFRDSFLVRADPDFQSDVAGLIKALDPHRNRRMISRIILALLGIIIVGLIIAQLTAARSGPQKLQGRLEPFSLADTPNLSLADVAARQSDAWFATKDGLFHSSDGGTANRIDVVGDVDLVTAAADPTGKEVWFSRGDTYEIGHFSLATNQVEWVAAPGSAYVTVSLQVGKDGTVWAGNVMGELFRRTAGQWQLLQDDGSSAFDGIQRITLNETGTLPILWAIGSSRGQMGAHRWQDDHWQEYTTGDLCPGGNCVLTKALEDPLGRAWIAHSAGITMLNLQPDRQVKQQCTAEQSSLLQDTITDMDISPDGHWLWLVTRKGLNALDISPMALPNNCQDWNWSSWSDTTFWLQEANSDYRLSAGSDVWIVEVNSRRVRWLEQP